MDVGLRGGMGDAALIGHAARASARRMAAGAARLLAPFGQRVPRKLLIAPQDLRTADPTLAGEIYAGHLKLAGKLQETHGRSPFELPPPSLAFAVELHGFGWLRHLSAADSDLSRANARALVSDWIALRRGPSAAVASLPDVTARRMISWLSQTPLLLGGADAAFYRTFVRALASDATHLKRARRAAPATELKLLIQIALTHYALCSAEADAELREAAAGLCRLLDAQVLSDGGHVSRNPQVVIDLLLDLLPLKLAFLWRRIQTPQPIVAAIDRMMPMLRMMRHADGSIALFNGMGATRADLLAAVLAQDDAVAPPPLNAPYAGYQRLDRGGAVLIADTAPAPRPPLASSAHAGPCSFEFSAEGARIVVNCGAPPAHRPELASFARVTAAHSTLAVADEGLGRFVRTRMMKAILGDQYIGGAKRVAMTRSDEAEASVLTLEHDGWRRHGFIHRRRLSLAADGRSLAGEDALARTRGKREVAYALRFHLHPQAKPTLAADGLSVEIRLANRSLWRFEADGATIALEESVMFASTEGLRRTEQIVVQCETASRPQIAWVFRKMEG